MGKKATVSYPYPKHWCRVTFIAVAGLPENSVKIRNGRHILVHSLLQLDSASKERKKERNVSHALHNTDTVETGNDVHTTKSITQVILFSKLIDAF
jgi:hypothetical protein